jgi:hypothetical protein
MPPIRTRRLRRPLAWLLIAQQLVAGAGISLPCPIALARSNERYPCEHCGCGCQSAAQCWTHCTCYTYQEKVAWAQKNGVAAPEFSVAAAEREAACPERLACPRHRCQRVAQTAEPSHDARHRKDKQAKNGSRLPRGITWLSALRCRGLTQQWLAPRTNWSGDRHVELDLVFLPLGHVQWQPFLKSFFSPLPPPTPPPNAA